MDISDQLLLLEQENQQLSLELSTLKLAYAKLQKSRQRDKALIKSLKLELEHFKNQANQTPKGHSTLSPPGKYELSLFSPKPARKLPNSSEIMSPSQSTGKTPQANPDQSVNSDPCGSYIYQGFFIIGIGKNQLTSLQPSILFEYCTDAASISSGIRKVITDLCFPTGASARKLKLSGSASDLNKVLYSQVPLKRNNSCFLFTLRAEEAFGDTPHHDLPNSEQELLYFLCIKIDDLCVDNEGYE